MSFTCKEPKLRFPEFSGDESRKADDNCLSSVGLEPKAMCESTAEGWEEKKLGDISFQISYGLTIRPDYLEIGIPLISARELKGGIVNYKNAPKISQKSYNELSEKAKANKGDIFLTKTGTIGLSAYVDIDSQIAVTQNIAVIRVDSSKYSHQFILQTFKTEKFQKLAISKVNQSTIMDLQLQDIRKLCVFIPSKPEQEKIASFLTAVDAKIEQLTCKEKNLEKYKKSVMQKLFSQELRFTCNDGRAYPEWEEKKLGEIAKITTGSSNREDSNLDGQYTFFDRSQDVRSSDRFLFDAEAIIVPGEGQEFIPKYFVGKFDLHQRTYAIMNFENQNGKFLFYSIGYNSNHLNSYAVGSTVKSLRLPMFQKMPIKLPSIEEQTKIANFLSAIDEKCLHVKHQLEQTQQFKKALLQQMFV